jgi:hypothetical protein
MTEPASNRTNVARPPHWSRREWGALLSIASPDVLCHAMWAVLEDPAIVLGEHHGTEGTPPWQTMIEGDWPAGWDARAASSARIAAARHHAARRPDRAERILRGVATRPVHWSTNEWAELTAEVDTDLCFEGLWVMTADPAAALGYLRDRPAPVAQVADPNGGSCWLFGSAYTDTHRKIVEFAEGRGAEGMTRAHVAVALGVDPTALAKETINRNLRYLVERGQLIRVPGIAPGRGGGDAYVAARHSA